MSKRAKSKNEKKGTGTQTTDMPEYAPTVSVIVPVQNSDDYIPILLHQLKEQNYTEFEALFIDAGSTDGSLDFVREYTDRDARFKLLPQKCEGKSAARNVGVKASKGKYVICLDPDDMIGADMLEAMVAPLKRSKYVDVVICDADEYYDPDEKFRKADWIVDKEVVPATEPFKASEVEGIYKAVCGYPTNKMIRKSLYNRYKLKWQELDMHDDMSLVQSAISLARGIVFINEKLLHSRVRKYDPANTEKSNACYDCIFEALMKIKDTLKRFKIWKKNEKNFNDYALDQCRWKYFAVTFDARQGVHDSLKNVWLEKLGIADLSKEDFSSEEDYAWMQAVLSSTDPIESLEAIQK